jgi:hypothetical protein
LKKLLDNFQASASIKLFQNPMLVIRPMYLIRFIINQNSNKQKQAWQKAGTPLIFALLYASTRGA